jgi:RNA polymerase sigma-70 factor, ECF subfamily
VLNEQEIIDGCKKYRQSAQKELFNKYAPLMRGLCIRYVFYRNEVKDVLQEGFLKVFSSINQYKGQGSFEGWIKRIMINHAINHYHKNKKHYHHLDIEEINEEEISDEAFQKIEVEVTDNVLTHDELSQNKLNSALLQRADFTHEELLELLNRVPEPFRIVFNLHCIEQFKHEEIADLLNISINTSRTRLLRARQILKQKLYEKSMIKIDK